MPDSCGGGVAMDVRGQQQYAVMALKDGWSKPRFVHDTDSRLLVYSRKEAAKTRARRLNFENCTFSEKRIVVRWIVCSVWTETMTKGLSQLEIWWP